MPELTRHVKDPSAVLDYEWDWTAWLASDTITTHLVTVAPTGTGALAVDSSTVDDTDSKVTVWLSGGVVGVNYAVTVSIVTAGGRTDDRTNTIHVRER